MDYEFTNDDSGCITGQQLQQKPGMVRNNAGGFGWQVDDIQRLKRFLVLGSEKGTYYTSSKTLGLQNATSVCKLITEGRGEEVVEILRSYSVEGRCAKQNSIVFCLALCACYHKDDCRFPETSQAAYRALPEICRISTDLFHFVNYCEEINKSIDGKTGWGRARRRAISKWYCEKPARSLAYQVTKYKQRDGWSHVDLLRLCHAKPKENNKSLAAVLKYVAKGYKAVEEYIETKIPIEQDLNEVVGYLNATEKALKAENEDELLNLISQHSLVREHIPTSFLSSRKIWHHLLNEMPLTAMIRNLGKMSSVGMFVNHQDNSHPGEEIAINVAQRITDEELLKKARIHPFNVLLALKTYETGKGLKGSNTWQVNKTILKALDEAFYLSFKFVQPTGKRYMLGVDVSGSMSYQGCRGAEAITPAVAAAAMAMVTLKTEENAYPMAFAHHFSPLNINKEMPLAKVMSVVQRMMMGSTDCALPMIYAREQKIPIDVFIVYTDCETWVGHVHPFQALQEYRKEMGIPDAKLIVCAMTSDRFTIADPDDPFMLDIVGFDSAAPDIISKFSLGEI